jgi:hypothetical protein
MLTGPPPKFHGTWDILSWLVGGLVSGVEFDGQGCWSGDPD